MKNIISLAILALLFPVPTFAQADFAITWVVSGIQGVTQLQIDLDVGTNVFPAHGVVVGIDAASLPITGTCILDSGGDLDCTLFVGGGSTGVLEVDIDTLNGTWETFSVDLELLESAILTFSNID